MEHVNNSASLFEPEDRYRQLVELCPDLIAVNAAGTIAFINAAGAKLLGARNPDELLGRPVTDFFHPDNRETSMERVRLLHAEGRQAPLMEEKCVRLDGSILYVEAAAMPITFHGQPSILVVAHDITARKQLEASLLEREEMFRVITHSAPEGILLVDNNGAISFWNSGAQNIFGYEQKEAIGMPAFMLLPQHMREAHWQQFEVLKVSGASRVMGRIFESWGCKRDGSVIPVEVSLSSWKTGLGPYYCAIIRDISQRRQCEQELEKHRGHLDELVRGKTAELTATNQQLQQEISAHLQSEQALRESENKFRMLAETTASAIVIFQRDRIVYANHAAETISGYSSAELQALDFWDLVHPGMRDSIRNWSIRRQAGEELSNRYELKIIHKTGELRWIDYTAAFIEYGGERAVLGTGVDITHRKVAEDALRNSEEQYRMLVQSANSIILRMDRHGMVKFLNEFALNFFGFQEQEIQGRSVVGTIVPKTDTLGRDLEAMIRDITRHPEHYSMNENENMLRSGERVWIAWTNKAIIDKEGNLAEILCIGTDITRSKLAEQRLLNYQKQLQSLASELSLAEERERRRIAVDLHDRIAQSMALARIKTEELSRSDHCAGMDKTIAEIRDLLDQTIQATRSLTFELCPPVLYELGFETALEWQMEEIRKLYGLTIHFENNLQSAPLDDDMRVILFQATRELLVNVAKHAGAKSARVCLEKNNSHIRINVEDDGAGFDMAEAERRVGKNGGFGLFSIRERLKYLGGHLECDSQQGRGTRIALVAPMKKN